MRCRSSLRVVMCCTLVVLASAAASAAVKLPALIGDNMVLQRGQPVPIWGWADKGEEVTVTVAGQKHVTKAGDDGRWKVTLDKLDSRPAARNDRQRLIRQHNYRQAHPGRRGLGLLRPVEHGDGLGGVNDAAKEIAAAKYPRIRLFTVEMAKAAQPADRRERQLEALLSANRRRRRLGRILGGGLFLRASIAQRTESADRPDQHFLGRHAGRVLDQPQGPEANPALKSLAQGESSCLYNGMIAPLIPYAIRGAIWYQGESNVPHAYQYRTLFPAMIANWRADWGQGDFPFGFVQIAPYNYHRRRKIDPACCAELWEAQLLTLKSAPNTGMAVTTDIGDLNDIHPKNKQEVGRRLALWALAKVYGRTSSIPARSTSRWPSKETRSACNLIIAAVAWRLATTSRLRTSPSPGPTEVCAGRGHHRRRFDRRA